MTLLLLHLKSVQKYWLSVLLQAATSDCWLLVTKWLQQQGVIRRFAAIVDAEKVERGLSVTIFADPISNAPESVQRFEALVLAMKGTVDVRRMFGRPDYIITVETRDLASYEELYQTDLAKLREIAHIESHIPMRVLRDRTSSPEPS